MEDLFEAVEYLEQSHKIKGGHEGQLVGQNRQFKEGYAKGWQQACHLLQEIGILHGLVASVLANNSKAREVSTNNMTTLPMEENFLIPPEPEARHPIEPSCKSTKVDDINDPFTPKVQFALQKLLCQLEDHNTWLKLGIESEEQLARKLFAVQAKARFVLCKLSIPTSITERAADVDF